MDPETPATHTLTEKHTPNPSSNAERVVLDNIYSRARTEVSWEQLHPDSPPTLPKKITPFELLSLGMTPWHQSVLRSMLLWQLPPRGWGWD